jgi:hypothetical protein
MTVEVMKCPKCGSTNCIPDIGYDGKFGMVWCAQCKTEFSSSWSAGIKEVLPYVRGFVLGYLVHAVIPQPYAAAVMLLVCTLLILNVLRVFK